MEAAVRSRLAATLGVEEPQRPLTLLVGQHTVLLRKVLQVSGRQGSKHIRTSMMSS